MMHFLGMLLTGNDMWGWLKPWLPNLIDLYLTYLVLKYLWRIYFAPPSAHGQVMRGSRLVQTRWWVRWLRGELRFFKRWWPTGLPTVFIGDIVFPRHLEPLHLLITGATGAGKSQTLYATLDTFRARGESVLATDVGGEALRHFGRTVDTILNPWDARSVAWSPFAEMESAADAERLAKSMIPDQDGREREWFLYSQALLAAALQRLWVRGDATNAALLEALTLANPQELKALVQGLPAQALFHEGAEKMLASVRAIVGSYLSSYRYLAPEAGSDAWSIRRHVREGKGWLWLTYREDQSAALRPLLAAWIGEAVNAVLSLSPDGRRRRWLLLDEVASLGRVQGLGEALTKGRKYGLCAMMGLQSISQLREAYGKDGAQTLLSCLSSQLLLRANDPETAEYGSQALGDSVILRESLSTGKDRSVTQHHVVERLVLASELQGLPDRVGYLRLAGDDRVRPVGIPIIRSTPHLEAFVPRPMTSTPVTASATPRMATPLDVEAILNSGRPH